jgi:hypothetical protein
MERPDASKYKTSGETEERGELLDAIDSAIGAIKTRLGSAEYDKACLTDLVRLLQLRKELEADRPRHISARWIDDDEC